MKSNVMLCNGPMLCWKVTFLHFTTVKLCLQPKALKSSYHPLQRKKTWSSTNTREKNYSHLAPVDKTVLNIHLNILPVFYKELMCLLSFRLN